LTSRAGATTENRRPLPPPPPAAIGCGAVLATLILRGSIRVLTALWIAATGTPTLLKAPSETAKLVTGLVCRKTAVFCVIGSQIESTSVSTKRFVGTNTYWLELKTTALPE